MSRLNWKKWGLTFWQSMAKHIGTAGATWLGLGLSDGNVDWHKLWVAMLSGAILPTFFKFLETSPVPEEIQEAVINVEKVELTVNKEAEKK